MFDSQILKLEPFGLEEGVRVLSDRFLVTRKEHVCVVCSAVIPPRSRVRSRAELNEGERRFGTFYFCVACCEAMVETVRTGNPDHWFNRWPSPAERRPN